MLPKPKQAEWPKDLDARAAADMRAKPQKTPRGKRRPVSRQSAPPCFDVEREERKERRHKEFNQYVYLAGATHAPRLVSRLGRLNLPEAAEIQLLGMAYCAALVVRGVKEAAICNRARGNNRLIPYAPMDEIWEEQRSKDPEAWQKSQAARNWAVQSDTARRAKLKNLAKLAEELSRGITEVTSVPSFLPLLPPAWRACEEVANMPKRLADLGSEIRCHLKNYRIPRGDRSEARLRVIGQLVDAFLAHTGKPQFDMIQDLLLVFTAGVSRAKSGSLRQDYKKYLKLLK